MPILSLPYTLPDTKAFEVFQLVQSIITAFYSAPQIYRIYERNSVHDISVWTWIIASISNVFWVIYGLTIQDAVVFVSSVIGLVLSCVLVGQWLYYTRREAYETIIRIER